MNNQFHNFQHDNSEQTIQHSKYYDNTDISKLFSKFRNPFSVLSLNAQSLPAKLDQIKIDLTDLENNGFYYDAVCIQETWLTDKIDAQSLNIDGYNLITKKLSCGKHGGLAIYLKEEHQFKEIVMPSQYNNLWECQQIEISIGKFHKKLRLTNVYRPPRNLSDEQNNFIDDLEALLSHLDNFSGMSLITGDFNADLLKIEENNFVNTFLEKLLTYSYIPTITVPTRYSIHKSSLIDNFFCRSLRQSVKFSAGVINRKLSDHNPYFIIIHSENDSKDPRYITICKYDTNSLKFFNDELNSINFNEILDFSPAGNVEKNCSTFLEIIGKSKDKHLPTITVKFNRRKHKISPWITKGLIKSINYRDKLFTKLKKTQAGNEKYEALKYNLRTYNNILKKSIREAKRQYYDRCFIELKHDLKGTWATINSILGRSKKQHKIPHKIIMDNTPYYGTENIANCFNDYFVNIGKNVASHLKHKSCDTFKKFLCSPTIHQFQFQNVTEKDTLKFITDIKPKSTRDIYGISSKLLQSIKFAISKPLTNIINQSFATGIFPNVLKIAKVIPVYKGNDPEIISNYRPISILPAVSKIFEKAIHIQLENYFEENNLFFQNQYGFRKAHSTELACLHLTQKLIWMIENNQIPINIYIDLQKAFDTIDHPILLSKLEYYGLKNTALELLGSYLTNRKQLVACENTKSKIKNIDTGVPQGSILGPLLFSIYINDINMATDLFEIVIYADDTTLCGSLNTRNNEDTTLINENLDKISNWLVLNKLSANNSKTKYMLFHNKQKKITPLTIKFNDNHIESVNQFNYLGITLDTSLTFNGHISKLHSTLAKTIGSLNMIKKFLSEQVLLQIYYTLLHSKLCYGLLVWGHNSSKLNKLQKRAVRIVTNSKYNAHTEPLFKRLNIPKISDIHKLQLYKLLYKISNNLVPIFFQNLEMVRPVDIHNYDTRTKYKLRNRFHRKALTENCIGEKIINTINNTNQNILEKLLTHSLDGFSRYVKQQILKDYTANCIIQNCHICNNN